MKTLNIQLSPPSPEPAIDWIRIFTSAQWRKDYEIREKNAANLARWRARMRRDPLEGSPP